MIDYITELIHSLTQSNTPTTPSISAIPIWTRKQTLHGSTGTAKHWKWCTWHPEASAKNSSENVLALWSKSKNIIYPWKCFLSIQLNKSFTKNLNDGLVPSSKYGKGKEACLRRGSQLTWATTTSVRLQFNLKDYVD